MTVKLFKSAATGCYDTLNCLSCVRTTSWRFWSSYANDRLRSHVSGEILNAPGEELRQYTASHSYYRGIGSKSLLEEN